MGTLGPVWCVLDRGAAGRLPQSALGAGLIYTTAASLGCRLLLCLPSFELVNRHFLRGSAENLRGLTHEGLLLLWPTSW
jgi:hypothetical protein